MKHSGAAKINPLLGRTAEITVNRKLGCRNIRHRNITYPVNIGYFELEKDLGERKHTVYIIGASGMPDTFTGTVIAVIRHMDSGRLFAVVSPEDTCYYEPEIRECLSFFEKQYVSEYEFYYEKRCGVIAYRIENGRPVYLLIRNSHNGMVCFPEVSSKFGETDSETAVRSLIVKTGIAAEVSEDFRTEYTVTVPSRAKCTSVYYTAEYTESIPRPADPFVSEVVHLPFEDALRMLDLPQDRIVLIEAHDHYELKEKNRRNMR